MEEILIQLFFSVLCMLVYLCAVTEVGKFLLQAVRHATNSEPLMLGVSGEGIAGRQSSSVYMV